VWRWPLHGAAAEAGGVQGGTARGKGEPRGPRTPAERGGTSVGPMKTPVVVILVENLPVPFDRRVWQEALALQQNGYEVHVVCPRTKAYPAKCERLDDVSVHRFWAGPEARRGAGFIVEYGIALASMFWTTWRISRRTTIQVIQACNPPDLLFLVAWPFVRLGQARFVFDHHDVSPELVEAKGHREGGVLHRLAGYLEARTFALAEVSIATNESFRRLAIERGGMHPDDVFVVRSAPRLGRFDEGRACDSFHAGRKHLVAYIGVMGAQDNVNVLLDAAAVMIHEMRRDVQFALAGDGPEFVELRDCASRLGLDDHVRFLGQVTDDRLLGDLLHSADICVSPDLPSRMNEISTMNKILEYMSVGKPTVLFDLAEGRFSAGESAVYIADPSARSLAWGISSLLDDPTRRERMGALAKHRLHSELSWELQVPNLLAAYERVIGRGEACVSVDEARSPRSESGGSDRMLEGSWVR